MTRVSVIVLSILLCVCTAVSKPPKVNAETEGGVVNGKTVDAVSLDNGDFCALIDDGNTLRAVTVDNNLNISEISLGVEALGACYNFYGNNLYVFTDTVDEDSLENTVTVRITDCTNGISRSRVISGIQNISTHSAVCVSDRSFFITSKGISVFDSSSELRDTIPINDEIKSLSVGNDGVVYVSAKNGITMIDGDRVTKLDASAECVRCVSDSLISVDDRKIIDRNSGIEVFDGFELSHGNAVFGSLIAGNIGGKLTAVDGDEKISLCPISDDSYICGNGEAAAVFENIEKTTRVKIYSREYVDERVANHNTESKAQTIEGNSEESKIEITVSGGYLTGIPQGITAAQLKKRSDVSEVYSTSGEISGKVGTGMKAVAYGKEYTVVVFGDVTGEGNINSKDLSLAQDYLMNEAELSDVYLTACDFNRDGAVDLKDVTEIYREMQK